MGLLRRWLRQVCGRPRAVTSEPELSQSTCGFDEQMEVREVAGKDATTELLKNNAARAKRRISAQIRMAKAKKARRKPLPQKVKEKRQEKERKKRDVVQIQDEEGNLYLRRRPLPDDPAYEGVVRQVVEQLPAEADQDALDAAFVTGVAEELEWLERDEEQMLPRYEKITKEEYERRFKESRAYFKSIVRDHETWCLAYENTRNPLAANILVTRKDDREALPVPWVGQETPAPATSTAAGDIGASSRRRNKKKLPFIAKKDKSKDGTRQSRKKLRSVAEEVSCPEEGVFTE